jgi:serine/threonine protein kinase
LYAFYVGKLAAETLTEIAEHIESCGSCATALDSLDDRSDPTIAELQRPLEQDVLTEVESQRAIALVEALATQATKPATDPGECTMDLPQRGAPRLVAGEQLGQYVLLEQLGEGGMGQVFKARHVLMDRTVAIKVILGKFFNHPAIVQRFLREIRALGRLDHPNIVRAQYADQVGDTHFLVMEYVAGTDLARMVRERGPLPVAQACTYILQAATGLQHAHEHGLVHRDIKPSNLLVADAPLAPRGGGVGGEGQVKLLDLGLAVFHEEQPAAGELTASGQVMGTADYMAPEQWENTHAVDIRADLYSLGCTLYHLLTGDAPFTGAGYSSMLQKMKAHVEAPVPPIQERRPEVPDGLVVVLDRLLAKDPADRYATPAEVVEALRPFTEERLQERSDRSLAARLYLRLLPSRLLGSKASGRPRAKRTIGCSLQLAITLSAIVLVVLGAWATWTTTGLFRAGQRDEARLARLEAEQQKREETARLEAEQRQRELLALVARQEKLRIESMRVSHHRGDPSAELGTLGGSSLSARFNDDVRVHVRLNRPAYCYLVAFNPDGKEQLCYPKDKNTPPPQNEGFDYPLEATKYFPLNDGIGLQAFVLLASKEPLPSYKEWKAKVGAAPWHKVRADNFWHFDGRDFLNGSRGAEVEREPLKELPKAFEDLCSFLKDRPGIAAIDAVAFPVKPNE